MNTLPSLSSGTSAMFNCLTRPLSNQSYRLMSFTCHPKALSSHTKLLKHVVKGSSRWSTSRGFWIPERWKHRDCGYSLKTKCQGSENSSPTIQKEEDGMDEKFRQNLLPLTANSVTNKPEICTADELHYVAVPGTNWRLALWRYHPSPGAPKRNHPLLLLSGIGTNALGFDLDPSVSMARYMAETGFETWILEVRGAGLSKTEAELGTEAEEEATEETGKVEVIRNEDAADRNVDTGRIDSAVEFGSESNNVKVETQNGSAKNNVKVETQNGSVENNVKVEIENGSGKYVGPSDEAYSMANHEEVIISSQQGPEGGVSWEAWGTATGISNTILKLSEKLTRLLSTGQSKTITARFVERISNLTELNLQSGRIAELRDWLASLIEARESGALIPSQISDLRKRLAKLLEDGQVAVSPTVSDLQDRLSNTVDEFQKIVDLIAKYDWDFDDYLNEDVPTALDYIRKISKPVDGKVMGIGHSMGGIVLYAHLSTRGCDSGLAAAVSLASALDYGVSETTLKLLLPLTDPAQILNVPAVPLGTFMSALEPLVSKPPYALAWLGYNVSAEKMMDTRLFKKLVVNNFCTIPVKLLLHLSTVFQPGGLQNRDGSIRYKQNICKCDVPVLALAADKDLICPPIAVLDTVKEFPKDMVSYKVFGGENGRHYGHYDLVCSPGAKKEVFPFIRDFLLKNDFVRVEEDKLNLQVSNRSG